MANRFFNQFRNQLEKGTVDLFSQVTIGNTGACTLVAAKSKGIKSITRNSAGDYTLTLQDTYNDLLNFDVIVKNASGICASPNIGIKAISLGTASGGTIEFVMSTGGAATDPASSDRLYIGITLSNSVAL